MQLLSYTRKGEKPSYDTFGGTCDATDGYTKDCLTRELDEEVIEMPEGWSQLVREAITTHPEGHNTYCSVKWEKQESHHTNVWFVRVPSLSDLPEVSTRFIREECVPDSLRWRLATDILENLNQYVFQQPLVLIIQGAQRQHNKGQAQRGRPIVQERDMQALPRKGIIEVCTGLGMMADSCVERGFASVIATCERSDLCRNLLQRKYPRAAHYCDIMEV